jgi:nitroreductase
VAAVFFVAREESMASITAVNDDRLAAVLRGRRSIDLFAPDPVPAGVVLEAIDVARWAPNHRLTQPWRFYLLGPEARRRAIDLAVEIDAAKKGERAAVARRARLEAVPGFLAVTTRRSEEAVLDREDYAACCCATQNLILYLWERGIGTKWTTGAITRHPSFYELLGVDAAKESVVGLIWYGVPKVVPTQDRLPAEAIVTELP